MTWHIRIRFPGGDLIWQMVATDQAAALDAARELIGTDGTILGWSRHKPPQW
jgi:hypothetical protein